RFSFAAFFLCAGVAHRQFRPVRGKWSESNSRTVLCHRRVLSRAWRPSIANPSVWWWRCTPILAWKRRVWSRLAVTDFGRGASVVACGIDWGGADAEHRIVHRDRGGIPGGLEGRSVDADRGTVLGAAVDLSAIRNARVFAADGASVEGVSAGGDGDCSGGVGASGANGAGDC